MRVLLSSTFPGREALLWRHSTNIICRILRFRRVAAAEAELIAVGKAPQGVVGLHLCFATANDGDDDDRGRKRGNSVGNGLNWVALPGNSRDRGGYFKPSRVNVFEFSLIINR